jgi:hypothetical protein
MKKISKKHVGHDELRPEYDLPRLKGWVRGKYLSRYQAGTNLVLLSPDVAAYFPDARSVNDALRTLIPVAKDAPRRARARTGSWRVRKANKASSGSSDRTLTPMSGS